MDTTFWDNFGKPTVHIDEFYENDACDDGIARLLEGRERQEEFTFQDVIDGHNITDDICWFILAMIDADFNVDHRQVTKLVLDYAISDINHTELVRERAQSCIDAFASNGKFNPREFDIASRVASILSFNKADTGARNLLRYINDNWDPLK